jgi:hypothetical protein
MCFKASFLLFKTSCILSDQQPITGTKTTTRMMTTCIGGAEEERALLFFIASGSSGTISPKDLE